MPRTSFKLNSKIADVGLAISVSSTVDSALLCSPARRFCELQVMQLGKQTRQVPRFASSSNTVVYVERAHEFPTKANAFQRSVTKPSLVYLLCYP
jgi:hypothetical protein